MGVPFFTYDAANPNAAAVMITSASFLGSDKSESVTIPFVLLNGMIKPPPPWLTRSPNLVSIAGRQNPGAPWVFAQSHHSAYAARARALPSTFDYFDLTGCRTRRQRKIA